MWNIPFRIYPKKLASTPVNIITGPITAVNPPAKARTCFTGPGKLFANWITLSIT